jgi:antitoxin component YwqK of YwqJK toxin-antitoxin module
MLVYTRTWLNDKALTMEIIDRTTSKAKIIDIENQQQQFGKFPVNLNNMNLRLPNYFKIGEIVWLKNWSVDDQSYFTGKIIYKYPYLHKTLMTYTSSYKNGLPHGIFKAKMYDGWKVYKYYFINGLQHGFFRMFHLDSSLQYQCQFKKGILNGNYLALHRDGNPETKTSFRNGVKHGLEFVVDYVNNRHYKRYFKNNKRHGRWVMFDKKTSDLVKHQYQHGRLLRRFKIKSLFKQIQIK